MADTPSSQRLIQAQSVAALRDLLDVLKQEEEIGAPSFIDPLAAIPNALGLPQQVCGGAKLGAAIFPPSTSPAPSTTQRALAALTTAVQNMGERELLERRRKLNAVDNRRRIEGA